MDAVGQLLEIAERLSELLVPVEADPNYRRRLKGELLLEGQRRQVQPQRSALQQHRKGILLGAAAVGSIASVVGVVLAFVVRYRHGRAGHIVAS
jgi:hypothetical protein